MADKLDGLESGTLYLDELAHVGVGWDDNPPGRGSGRYPHGSGERPNQHLDLYEQILNLRKDGLTEDEIRSQFHMNTSQYRAAINAAKKQRELIVARKAQEMAAATDENGKKLYSNVELGKMFGVSEGTIRNYLKMDVQGSSSKIVNVMDKLKEQMKDGRYLDVGTGAQYALGCSEQMLKNAVKALEAEGYQLYPEDIKIDQLGTGKKTILKTLAPPGTTKKEIYQNLENIKMVEGNVELWPEGNKEIGAFGIKPPTSVDSDRVMIRYAEDGGKDRDGVIELRRGVDDLMMGNASYAQVRIAVDGTHYLKGMAIYGEDSEFPPGKDIIFNTNKHTGTPMLAEDPKAKTVLKSMKENPDNPFGATIKRQIEYTDKDGKIILSPINIVNEEGSWGGEGGWSKSIASQMLSKQTVPLIEKQLKLSYADRVADFDDIMSLENPVIKKKCLDEFADACDRASVDLKASPFPGQSWKVILPVPSLKDNEIYASTYDKGDHVVLVRYPHGGTHEIPELVVNNDNKEGKIILGQAVDAVGINPKVAARLSGADFDGDTVLVIPANGPNSRVRIQTRAPFEGLDTFDPKEEYPEVPGMKYLKEGAPKQKEMGVISNLITDMTLKGAPDEELARAIRHSMVIIDAPKHKLNYKLSEEVNNIDQLKRDWQITTLEDGEEKIGGASTLISRAKGVTYIPDRKEGIYVTDPITGKKHRRMFDPETGEKEYTETGETKKVALKDPSQPYKLDPDTPYVINERGRKVKNYILDKSGKKVPNYLLDENGKKVYVDSGELVTTKSTQMADTKDARTLSSGTPTEMLYADYANKLKALANEARKATLAVPTMKRDPEAAKLYAEEVKSLDNKLMLSLKNAPRERQAQLLGGLRFKAYLAENPDMTSEEKRKYKNQCLVGARERVGASKYRFNGYSGETEDSGGKKKKGLVITPKEWEAIQAGAISHKKFSDIVRNSETSYIRSLATPKATKTVSPARINKMKAMSASGFTLKEIADQLNLSPTTVAKYLKG